MRDVHAHLECMPPSIKEGEFIDSKVEYRPGQLRDEAGSLCKWYEVVRLEKTQRWMLPSHERLNAVHGSGQHVARRLEMQRQTATFDRDPQVVDHRQAFHRVDVDAIAVEAHRVARALRLIHCDIGTADKFDVRRAVLWPDGDPDARTNTYLGSADRYRVDQGSR